MSTPQPRLRLVADRMRRFSREAWTPGEVRDRARRALAWARARPRTAGAVGAAVAMGGLALWSLRPAGAPPGIPTAVVRSGPFRVTVMETGTVQALRSVTYSSQIQSNQAKIVALAPEGRVVQKGDLLILFDSAPFEAEIRRSQAALAQAEAELAKARQDLNLQVVQNREELATARQKLERSELELKDVEEGKGRLREQEAEAAVKNAERDLQKAQGAWEDLKPLLDEGFITRQELDRAEQAVERAREDLALARRRKESLLVFGRPLELSEARSGAALTRDSVRELETTATFRVEQKKAAIAGAESRITEATAQLNQAKQQLGKTEVRADVPGIVVYRDLFVGTEPRKPQVGDQVWANQPLLILPDISRMVVETRVRETDVHKVARNQHVSIGVDAYPDLKLTGQVTLVGTLAQEEKERRGTKAFGVTIQVDQTDDRLRPGMTARAEIQAEERPAALFVPLEAVFTKDGRSLVYAVERGGVREREVVLGPSNANFVVVEKGVEAGETVCLRDPGAPPTDFGSRGAE